MCWSPPHPHRSGSGGNGVGMTLRRTQSAVNPTTTTSTAATVPPRDQGRSIGNLTSREIAATAMTTTTTSHSKLHLHANSIAGATMHDLSHSSAARGQALTSKPPAVFGSSTSRLTRTSSAVSASLFPEPTRETTATDPIVISSPSAEPNQIPPALPSSASTRMAWSEAVGGRQHHPHQQPPLQHRITFSTNSRLPSAVGRALGESRRRRSFSSHQPGEDSRGMSDNDDDDYDDDDRVCNENERAPLRRGSSSQTNGNVEGKLK